MKISDKGLALLKLREGVRSAAYRDSAGHLTIGVGHLLTKSELSSGKIRLPSGEVNWRDGLTTEQIDELLRQDLERFELAVQSVHVIRIRNGFSLADHQYDALVSFAFNVGVRAFTLSTLADRVAFARDDQIPDQLRRWVYAGGKVVEGLKKRRESEIAQWLTPYETYQPQPATVEERLTHLEIAAENHKHFLDNVQARLDGLEQRVMKLEQWASPGIQEEEQ